MDRRHAIDYFSKVLHVVEDRALSVLQVFIINAIVFYRNCGKIEAKIAFQLWIWIDNVPQFHLKKKKI